MYIFLFPLSNLSYSGLCEACYHGDVLTPLALPTFSASTAAGSGPYTWSQSSLPFAMKPVWVQLLYTCSKMLTFQLNASVPTAELPSSEMSFDCGQRGLGAPECPTLGNFRIGAGGGQAALRRDQVERNYPGIQPRNSESACVLQLLQAVAADAVQLCCDVQGFSGLGHQAISKMRQIKDLILAGLGHF